MSVQLTSCPSYSVVAAGVNVSFRLRNVSFRLRNVSFRLRNVSFRLRDVSFSNAPLRT